MNNKILLATVAGGIAAFLLGWLVYGIALDSFYKANTTLYEGLFKEMPNLLLLFIANLASSYLLAYVFSKMNGINSFADGFVPAMIIGLTMSLSYDLFFLSMLNLYNSTLVIVDIIVSTIFTGIIGGIIAMVLSRGNKATA